MMRFFLVINCVCRAEEVGEVGDAGEVLLLDIGGWNTQQGSREAGKQQ
jgi:hypothetical protein